MIKLLAFCDDPSVCTGFGRVADHLLYPLADSGEYDVHLCAANYQGDSRDPARYPYHYYVPFLSERGDWIGLGRMASLIKGIQPDVVFIQQDMDNIAEMFQRVPALKTVPTVIYTPVDGDPFPARGLIGLRQATAVATYTEYGKRAIAQAAPDLEVQAIPLGHDPSEFYPLADTKAGCKAAARQILNVSHIPDDAFIVLRVDKNQERKQWPATLRVFGEFVKTHPNAYLWAHTSFSYGPQSYDIGDLIHRYGLPEKHVLNPGFTMRQFGCGMEELNAIYNLADVFLSTAAGGGWELGIHEAQACGTPTIVCDYAAMGEIGACVRVPWVSKYTSASNSTEYAFIDEWEALVRLQGLADLPVIYDVMRARALAWAEGATWDAHNFVARMDALLRGAMARYAETHKGAA